MIKKIWILLLIVASSLGTFAQNASSSADLKKQQAAIQKEIDELKQQLAETNKYKRKSLAELNLVQKKLRLRESQIKVINDQINLIQSDINQSWRDIVKLRAELDTLKIQYQKSVVYAYKNRSNYDFVNFIFSAGSFNDALKRMAYLKSYRAYREQQAINIANTQSQLEQKINNLNLSKKEKSSALEEQNKQFKVLAEERAEKNAVVSKIKSQERELTKEMTAKRKQDNKLKSAISAAIKREIAAEKKRLAELEKERKAKEDAARKAAAAAAAAAKKEEGSTAATKTPTKTVEEKPVSKPTSDADVMEIREEIKLASNIFEKNQGGLPWPVNSRRITMKFGRNKYEGLNVDYENEGITIEAEANSSIKAVFDGEVSAIFTIGSVQAVILKHGKYFTTYSNLSRVLVSKGDKVKTGQLIGRLEEKEGGRGELEFLITNDNQINLNPELWLGK
ncbi:peptidoglycan DD-metalloendopeptidase family protein [Flavihumibacter sp. RY-1]|uniref:Peptidoglycan DD-metalloendopeptidase family protein n=1 Tax=Flavihumibacter fluminis TaxID=2909236 RepID=A0ABS9BNS9_9BACT|nr:peptidoglycan DD-metalloendopeptidase family protein [Flavihumibacter fluminis]MCF1716648.1 peptidoglycan DD-metalloendopeptidase family protein [Flavihumibacter fluminis]